MSFNIAKTKAKRVVIVGGGFGGLKLANALRNSGMQVVLVDKNNYHQFPPLIYQVASSGLEPSSISFPFRKIFRKRKNFYFRMAEARSIFPEKKILQTSIGKVEYDYLVFAAGTTTNFFGNKHLEDEAMPMKTLSEAMEDFGIPGISGVDTRQIARIIRDEGSQRVLITDADMPLEECLAKLQAWEYPRDVVRQVSCKRRWYSRTSNPKYNVAVLDCGIKLNIVREMNRMGCNVTVLPFDTKPEDILRLEPDGLFLSTGPGDPENVTEVIETVRTLKGQLPIFGICLGHQMISLACGAHTYKMKFGHRGGNHPVLNQDTGRIEITSQNHSYAVDPESLRGTGLRVTHINLLDQTIEGVEDAANRMFSVQYHPESAPGPQDSNYLFEKFLKNMDIQKQKEGSRYA